MAAKMTLYKLVVMGDSGVGKSAMALQLFTNYFEETYDPTIEDSYRRQVVAAQQSYMLEVLDTSGDESYEALRDEWIRDGDGFVLVYSTTSRNSFSQIRKFYAQVQQSSPATFGSIPIMLVGNKADEVDQREISSEEGEALALELGCDFLEASAKSGFNVEKAFCDVVPLIQKSRDSEGKANAQVVNASDHKRQPSVDRDIIMLVRGLAECFRTAFSSLLRNLVDVLKNGLRGARSHPRQTQATIIC